MSAAEHWGRVEQPILQALAAGDGAAMSGQQLVIAEESDERERSKLEGVLGAVKTLGGMTLSAVIANAVGVARSHLGLG
jgi:hypothetical protein